MRIVAGVFALAALSATGSAQDPVGWLKARGRPPADYVLGAFREHRVVILGEAHWIRHDVRLVLELVPRLGSAGVGALGVEMFRASDQGLLDRLVLAEAWDETAALRVMRAAEWPYREYFEILRAAWSFNGSRAAGTTPLTILALGPDPDWREKLLPLGKTYDTIMAERVMARLATAPGGVLVYCGISHGFTRYVQPEMPRERRVEQFFDRMGNVLRRNLGEDVFLVALHHPWPCRQGSGWGRCLPVEGAIDCAATGAGRPVGFDLAGSPFAGLPISPGSLYAQGYPAPRLGDLADGWVWTKPIAEYDNVTLIPLSEFAPDAESLQYVAGHDPFSDEKGLDRAALEKLWEKQRAWLAAPLGSRGWQRLAHRDPCAAPKPGN